MIQYASELFGYCVGFLSLSAKPRSPEEPIPAKFSGPLDRYETGSDHRPVDEHLVEHEFLHGSEERSRREVEHRSHVIERNGCPEDRRDRDHLPGERRDACQPVACCIAEAARNARFEEFGHTPGPAAVPAPEPNPDYPLTLDLRRTPSGRHGGFQ